ncbi:uncharacterized protein Bfra_010406 [Botrytis fragariae]|uniref:Uncharacterized protein n=1 Tax=Botrytis fragariae TaxID=1964551 RepID=A0A8H6AH27_9HELO|nr:uncharacterized protein Bfra_010406 [Botrytis fragariae]KAF5867432.1 hypothetical protein Bfra_010406 [Botrytis fragariae]
MNPVKKVNHKMEHDGIIIEYSHHEAKQSSIAPREDKNEKMVSPAKLAAKEISPTISEVQRSFAKSEAEPRSGDASLSASSSISNLVQASYTERHLETEDTTENALYSTSIAVQERQGPPYGAGNMVLGPTNSIYFDNLPAEIQYMIIKECIPERNHFRLVSVSLDPNNQILLNEDLDIKHTSILFVSRAFRRIYLKHLPIVLPSLNKNIPVCIHQDTTLILKMEEPDHSNIRICYKGRIPASFSEIRHLAVPLHLLSFFNITADVRSRGERIQELAVAHNISFLSRLIFACSNLRSLTAVQHNTAEKWHLKGLNYPGSLVVPKVFSSLLRWNLESLANFLNLQRAMTGYRSKKLACRVMVFTLGSSVNKVLSIPQVENDTLVYFRVNKENATRIAHLDIESFIDKYCYSSPQLAELPENLLSERGRTAIRAVLRRLVTRWMEKYFNSNTNIEDAKHGREILELMEDAFEQHKRSNPGEVNLSRH